MQPARHTCSTYCLHRVVTGMVDQSSAGADNSFCTPTPTRDHNKPDPRSTEHEKRWMICLNLFIDSLIITP